MICLKISNFITFSEEKDENQQKQTEIKNEVISIELPNEGGIRKRKKKGFDMEAYVKRQLGRAQRELQMLKHHAHVVCLLSHLRHLNSYAAFPPGELTPKPSGKLRRLTPSFGCILAVRPKKNFF